METRISFTEDRSIQRIFPLNRVNYDSLPDFVPPYFREEMGRPVARSISTDRVIGLKVGRNWSSIIASSLFLSPFSKNCSKANGCLNTVGARCPAFQLINETKRAGVESRGGGMENQERAAVILG